MGFDAGAIEGSMTLDIDPFIVGLDRAADLAERWEVAYGHIRSTLDLDSGLAETKLDVMKERLDEYGAEDHTARLNLDTTEAEAKLLALQAQIDAMGNGSVGGRGGGSGGKGGSGEGGGGMGLMGGLIGLGVSLAPALGPAIAAVGLFGSAAVAGFGAAAVAVAGYAKLAEGALAPVEAAIKAHKQLTGVAGQLETSLVGLEGAYHKFQAAIDPGILKTLNDVFGIAASVLPRLVPLVNAIGDGLRGALTPFKELINGPIFSSFLTTFEKFAKNDLPLFGTALANTLGMLMGLFHALQPEITMLANLADRVSKSLEGWANTKADSFITSLLSTISKYGPATLTMFSSLGGALASLGKGLAPLTGPALTTLTALFKGIGNINLAPLAKGLGALFVAIDPLLPLLGKLISAAIIPLGDALSGLSLLLGPVITYFTQNLANPKMWDVIVVGLGALVLVLDAFGVSLAITLSPLEIIIAAVVALGLAAYEVKQHWAGISKFFEGLWDGVKSVFNTTIHWISGTAVSLFQGAVHGIVSAFDTVKTGITSKFDAVMTFIRSIPGKIKGVFGSALTWLTDAGKWILQGLINGATGIVGKVVSTFTGIGSKIKSALGGIFHFGSPSKLTTQWGVWIMQGMLIGANSQTNKLTTAFKNLGAQIADAFATGTKAAETSMVNSVTAAMNKVLSAAQTKLKQLQSMLSNVTAMKSSVVSAFGDSGLFGYTDQAATTGSSTDTSTSSGSAGFGAISLSGNTLVQAVAGDGTTATDAASSGTAAQTALQQFLNSLQQTDDDALQATGAITKLQKWGLDPGFLKALEQSGNVQLITELAATGETEAKAINKEYTDVYGTTTVNSKTGAMKTTGGILNALGNDATTSVYGTTQGAAQKAVNTQQKAVNALSKSIDKLETALKTLTDDNKKNNASQTTIEKDLHASMKDLNTTQKDFKKNLPDDTGKAITAAMKPIAATIDAAVAKMEAAAEKATQAAAAAANSSKSSAAASTAAADTSTNNAKTLLKAVMKK